MWSRPTPTQVSPDQTKDQTSNEEEGDTLMDAVVSAVADVDPAKVASVRSSPMVQSVVAETVRAGRGVAEFDRAWAEKEVTEVSGKGPSLVLTVLRRARDGVPMRRRPDRRRGRRGRGGGIVPLPASAYDKYAGGGIQSW